MAGFSEQVRDLDEVHAALPRWWAERHPDDLDVAISPFRTNPSSGFSSESLLFDVEATRSGDRLTLELVLRLPPAGGGLFPEYDLERQARTQTLLSTAGVPAPAPVVFEGDERWLGSPFLVMPRIAGNIPGDYSYFRKGWLFDASPEVQRAHHDGFVDGLVRLLTIDPAGQDVGFLARDQGHGLAAELAWWTAFLDWACEGERHPVMHDAYDWARATMPPDDDPPSILWGDARFSNVIFDEAGQPAAMLDWEQAAVGPAELDVGFWLATRRQTREVFGVEGDRELPGFPPEAEAVADIEAGLGRPLRAMDWHEAFAMVRMGTCIVSTAALLQRAGQHDHPFVGAPVLPQWTIDLITDDRTRR